MMKADQTNSPLLLKEWKNYQENCASLDKHHSQDKEYFYGPYHLYILWLYVWTQTKIIGAHFLTVSTKLAYM